MAHRFIRTEGLKNKKLIVTGIPKTDHNFNQISERTHIEYVFKINELDKISDAVDELIKSGKVEEELEMRLSANKYNL